jgi:WD40 repeat protein
VWSLHGRSAAAGRPKKRTTSTSTATANAEPSYCINTFTAHDYWVNSLKFRGNTLISGAADDTIKIWDFSAGSRQRAGGKKTSGLWYADVVSSRPQPHYITNPITSACILS